MRGPYTILGVASVIVLAGAWYAFNKNSERTADTDTMKTTLSLTSTVFENGDSIPSRYTCDDENISPPLTIMGVPEGVAALALIVDDRDVPKQLKPDGVFNHWTLFNIPSETKEIIAGSAAGVAGANGSGRNQYTGPCPPPQYEPSEHRYFFKLFALDTMLDLSEGATKEEVLAAMQGHIIEEVELMGKYRRVD